MALIIEDGTGKANAESYVSAADCLTYAANHGLTFPADEATQEARLRRATQYLDSEYTYKGTEESDTQALSWPRDVMPGAIPSQIINACCELACKPGDLWQDVDASPVIEDTIGPLTTKYAAPVEGGQVRFASVDAMLRRWVAGGGNAIKLVRA